MVVGIGWKGKGDFRWKTGRATHDKGSSGLMGVHELISAARGPQYSHSIKHSSVTRILELSNPSCISKTIIEIQSL